VWQGLIRQFAGFLPKVDLDRVITLNEGNTPLIEARRITKRLPGGVKVYFKYEGLNPTGSFKDRGMTMAITQAYQTGSSAVICASTGNTSASAAAYAARAGMRAFVLIPDGKIALGKLSQAMIHGATVVQIEGNFDDALNLVRDISNAHPITLVNSVNPFRIEGQKTGAFEVCEQLGDAPTYHSLPVGNAGNITAYWKGYVEYFDAKKATRKPKMIGFQAAGSAPIVLGHPVANPETVATAIRIGNPASWKQAEAARDASGGLIDMVTDEEILDAYGMLAAEEGVFCEPASAASVAGLLKKKDLFKSGDVIVCTLTGHGLKDPDNAIKRSQKPVTVKSDMPSVLAVLGFR
jgi:threonine synthase